MSSSAQPRLAGRHPAPLRVLRVTTCPVRRVRGTADRGAGHSGSSPRKANLTVLRYLIQNDSVRSDGCSRYAAGHRVHWIHAKKCLQEPGQAVEILLTSSDVGDDGWVELRAAFDYAGALPAVWTHAPGALRKTLAGHRGRVYWLARWHALKLEHGGGEADGGAGAGAGAAAGLVNVGLEGGELCGGEVEGDRAEGPASMA